MDASAILQNLLSAPLLFFALGMLAALVKSDLELPHPIPRLLSIYLLVAIGLKGGVELGATGADAAALRALGVCVLLSALTPVWTYLFARWLTDRATAAAVAATYGSVSAVTFIIAASFLDARGVAHGGHMVAAMALMESPAIVVGIMLYRMDKSKPRKGELPKHHEDQQASTRWTSVLHDAALNGAVVLLVGSLIIGMIIGHEGFASLEPFAVDPFKGVLCLFLLDMGLLAARRMSDLRRAGWRLVLLGVWLAVVHALLGILLARLIGASPGDAVLIAVLAGSASYIAVPAAMRLAVPEASPSVYVTLALGVTFPFNVVIGIPLYTAIVTAWWGGG